MRPLRALPLVLLLGLFAVGASCDDHRDGEAPPKEGAPSAGNEKQVAVADLDVDAVDDMSKSDRERYGELVNDLLSPCGDPVSLARCVTGAHGKCATCAPAARYVARLVNEGYANGPVEEMYRKRYGADSKVDIPLDGSPVRGSPMAPVTIVEFSDFECPFCGAAFPVLERVVEESDGHVRMVFKQYPLDAHPHSRAAARAAIAAGKQGKFWQMHDLLFEHQSALEPSDIRGYARKLGLDMDRFEKDTEAPSTEARIEKDRALGHKLGLRGTPTIYVNGRLYEEPLRNLSSYIEEIPGE